MARVAARRVDDEVRRSPAKRGVALPRFIEPQLALLVGEAPTGDAWVHELKLDGYRIQARIDRGKVQLLTRSGLDWTERYPATADALAALPARNAYLDGELCALDPDGRTSFADMQAATDGRTTGQLVYFAFDLLHLDGEPLGFLPLLERKARLLTLLAGADPAIRFNEHLEGDGPVIRAAACGLKAEGVVSKRADHAYVPGNRGIWRKSKCLNRQEFVVVGWTEGRGSRPHLGSLLVGYHDGDGHLRYAGRAGTGMSDKKLAEMRGRLEPLAISKMPLAVAPPKTSRFGSRLELSKVHWVKPQLVVEVTFLSWTADGLIRHVVFQGVREDKRATDVVLERV